MKLNYKRTLFVGFAFFLICVFWQAYDTIIPKILTDKFGMSQSWSGVIMALDNVLALFLLPLFGALSDKCKSPRGRRTPYIVVGTVMAALFLLLLSAADGMQLKNLSAVAIENPTAQATLYDANLTVTTPEGETVAIREKFTKEQFAAIKIAPKGSRNQDYMNYVVPARQAYAAAVTAANRAPLVFFIVVLLLLLLSMSIFRSPAVALMPDVTIKPLRSKANAIINLMGSAGGITVLILGMRFGTGRARNALMGYAPFFACVSGIMIVSLLIFLWKVKEPQYVAEMHEDSKRFGIEDESCADEACESQRLSGRERVSLLLILASVMLWFFGYNAVTSKYSVYASSVLNQDYNATLTIATGIAILSYLPVGMLASKIGRKKSILGGIVLLGGAFFCASFIREGTSPIIMNIIFAAAGIGWATINVNSYPMVVELSRGRDVGKYTGFYYTASMAAQTITPIFSGLIMDRFGMSTLFPYGCVFVSLAFVTMLLVKHGDNRPAAAKSKLEAFAADD